jgi:hypothetical protein
MYSGTVAKLTSNALTRLAISLASAATISTPCAAKAWAAAPLTLRVIPRTLYAPDFNAEETTEPPWAPVAPTTVRILDMVNTDGKGKLSNVEF